MGSRLIEYSLNDRKTKIPENLRPLFDALEERLSPLNANSMSLTSHRERGNKKSVRVSCCGQNGDEVMINIKYLGFGYKIHLYRVKSTDEARNLSSTKWKDYL